MIVCLNLAAGPAAVYARAPAAPSAILWVGDRPHLICDEPEHCFGTLSNTNEVRHFFTLSNEGELPLNIYRVRTDCGCTLVRLEEKNIHPGEQIAVEARLILKGRSGRQHKRISIESNDPDNPRLTLSLIGEAVAEAEVKPDRIYWGNLRSDATEVKTVEIRFHESLPARITSVGAASPAFAVGVQTNKPGLSYALQVRPVPPLALGRFTADVHLTTDSPRYPRFTVPMLGRVVGDIYAVPEELTLASRPAGNAAGGLTNAPEARLLMVQSSQRQPFNILKVEPPLTNMEVRIRSTLSRGYRIELKNIVPAPSLDGKPLVITTDCETMPTLKVLFRFRSP